MSEFGPQSAEVTAIIDRMSRMTAGEARGLADARFAALDAVRRAALGAALDDAWDAAGGASLFAAWDATLDDAWYAAGGATLDAAWDAVTAEVTRDLITPEQYNLLMGPWREVMGGQES